MYGLIFDFNFEFNFLGGWVGGWVNIPLILKVTVVI